MLLLSVATAQIFQDYRRLRLGRGQRRMFDAGEITMPAAGYYFDDIVLEDLDPEISPFDIVNGTTSCHCSHLCLTQPHCLTYVHEAEGGSCSLFVYLLPGEVLNVPPEERSVGRRRGVSWLGAPCHADSDCSQLVSGAECGPEQSCVCSQSGWTEASRLQCRPDGRWVTLTTGSLEKAVALGEQHQASLPSCEHSCRRSKDCWAYSYTNSTALCRLYAAAVVTDDLKSDSDTVLGVWEFGRSDGAPPEGYHTVSGRHFLLTEPVTGPEAAAACLQLEGVPYAPESQDLMSAVGNALQASTFTVGLNDQLQEGRFDAADGVTRDNLPWAVDQPDGATPNEDCVRYQAESNGLRDTTCSKQLPQLCEYIGPNLVTSEPSRPRDDADRQLTWWTVDLGAILQVGRVLYLAADSAEQPLLTEIRVGSHPENVTGLQSTPCFSREGPLAAAGISLRLACTEPRAGRYLHVGQRPGHSPLWERLAVYGN